MKNGLKIRWTEEATNNLERIILYLEANWTSKELTKFFTKFEKQLMILSLFPDAYPFSKRSKNIHRCVLSKNLTIYYGVENEFLVLFSIFDTRRNPSKVKI